MKQILKRLIIQFQERGLPKDLIPREVNLSPFLKTRNAMVVTGPRRAGKTYLMFQIMKELRRPLREIIYINFEDNVLVDFTPANFEDIITAYKELYPHETPVIFLDEVHNIPRWEIFARKLVDNHYRVFITGSNAQLLSKEYATRLGGRYLELEIFPLTFREYLKFRGVDYDSNVLYSDRSFQLISLFETYMNFGGFPEVTLADDDLLKEKLISSYFKTAFFRDIINRFKIRDDTLFEIILKKAAENIGNPFSFRSIRNKLTPLGYNVSPKTIIQYFDYAVNGYLLVPSYLKRESVLKREVERKMYFIDNGYLQSFYAEKNQSKKLENIVALNLRFQGHSLQYFRNTVEIDFLLSDSTPVQVCFDLSPKDTSRREVKALIKYLNLMGRKNGYILTWNETQTFEQKGKTINILPAWYFLLFRV